jgi:O-antigen ligase
MDSQPLRLRSFQSEPPLKRYGKAARAALRALALPALVLSLFILSAASGLMATQLSPFLIIGVLAALAIFVVTFSKPVLVASSTVIDLKQVPSISIGFRFSLIEICILFLLMLAVSRAMLEDFVQTPLDVPLLLFFAASTISFFNAMLNLGTDKGYLIPYWRVLFAYLMFFVVTNLVRTRRQFLTLTVGLLVLGSIVAVLMIIQAGAGPSVKIVPNVGTATVLGEEYADVFRVMPPGMPLVLMLFLPALTLLALSPEYLQAPPKWALAIMVPLLLAATAFTFSRTWWLGIAAALGILVVMSPPAMRRHVFKTIIGFVLIASLALTVLTILIPRTSYIVEILGIRAGSFMTGEQILNDSGTQWRLRENTSAILKIQENPLLGVGPGGRLRYEWWNGDELTRYMHNSYLFMLADLGVLGFLPFLWFSILFLGRGFFYGRRLTDPFLKSWVLALTLSYVALLIASMAGPEFMTQHTTPVIGTLMGVSEVAIRLSKPTV